MFIKDYDDEEIETVFDDEEPEKTKELNNKNNQPTVVEVKPIESQIIEEPTNDILPAKISSEMRSSFLDYAMSVIVSRALPNAYDGLKPVHRRILYAMSLLGLDWNKPHKKAARIVGEVLGKFHPHSDAAAYDAMVRMAQEFSMRYPLVDGHGNFGSIDGDSAAAMRYTEARLSKLASFMVDGINKDTVDFVDNYDATEKEPVVLPARFPNLLISGSTGIAVGMATNIPPHNINEVIDGVIAYAQNPDLSFEELINLIKGPDFPTGGIILGTQGIQDAYLTGRGSITVRSKTSIKTSRNGRQQIIIHEIPYMVNKAKMIEKISVLIRQKVIEGITDLRDESNRKGIKIVFEVRKNIIPEVILNKLFKLTQLQSNFNVNMIALNCGQPQILTLKKAISSYLNHQINVVTRKTNFDLNKALEREHILIGLQTAVKHIDEVIKIIRGSNSDQDAQTNLITKFKLSPIQAKSITDMRLGRLTGLAIEKMTDELNELKMLIIKLREIITNKAKLINVIVDELKEVKTLFGDQRRTRIVPGITSEITEEDLIPVQNIAITLSIQGYVKRIPLQDYRIQKRGGMGSKTLNTYEDDDVNLILTTTTHTDLLIFTNSGHIFRLKAYKIPALSKTAKGIPILNLINIDKTSKVILILPIDEYLENTYLTTITKKGMIKKTPIKQYQRINRNGKYALGLKPNDVLFKVLITHNDDEIIIGSREGKVTRFKLNQVRSSGRTAIGVKGINLSGTLKNNQVVGADLIGRKMYILAIGEGGFGKMTLQEDYRKTNRGMKGVKTINTKKTGSLVFVATVNGDEDIIVLTSEGVSIRTSLSDISRSSRLTKGVTIIKLKPKVKIKSVALIETQAIVKSITEEILKTQEREFLIN